MKPHAKARRARVIAIHEWAGIERIDDNVQVTVAIKIHQGHAVRWLGGVKPPGVTLIFEGEIATIAIRYICTQIRWMKQQVRPRSFRTLLSERANAIGSIAILHIEERAISNEEVFVSIQVYVQKCALPGPVGGRDPGIRSYLTISAIA